MVPQELRHPIAAKCTRQSGKERGTSEKIETDTQDQVVREETSISSDYFRAPSKNVKYETIEGRPLESRSGTHKTVSAQKRANPQGVQIGHS